MTNEITTTNGAMTVFGTRDEIKEMAERLQAMMPGTTRLDATEARTVAQIAVAHGLDPFNGEVWGIKGENNKWYGVMVGIKGLRKAARREADRNGSNYWTELRQVKPETYNANAGAIVYECILRDTASVQAYGKSINILTSSGMPYKEAVEVLGPAPKYVGIGIASPDERSKMGIHQRAKKRAEADAIRQAYDVNFTGASVLGDSIPDDAQPVGFADDDAPQAIEAQYRDEPAMTASEALRDLGYEQFEQPPAADDEGERLFDELFEAWKEIGATDQQARAKANKGLRP